MAELETRVDKLEDRVTNIEFQVTQLSTKVDVFIEEMRDFKTEMRDRDNQRVAEIRELRQKQDAMQAKHDEDMKAMQALADAKLAAMENKIDSLGNHIRNYSITAIGVIVAIFIAAFLK